VEVEIFIDLGNPQPHRDRNLRGFDRAGRAPEFLQHDLNLGSDFISRACRSWRVAVAAIVIEEFDEGDVAVLVADGNRRVASLKIASAFLATLAIMFLGLGGGLALCSVRPWPLRTLGMRHQIVLTIVSMSPRWTSEKLCADCGRWRAKEREREQCGASRRNEGNWLILWDGFLVERWTAAGIRKNLRQVGLF